MFSMFKGVVSVTPGYAGGSARDPTYEQVCNGNTGHAEVLEIEYDPSVIPLGKILKVFFKMHDPTQVNRQGNDIGTQYRSIILYTSAAQKSKVERFIANLQKSLPSNIMTEVKRLGAFYPAEDYHKDFYKKNPINPYCIFVIRPKLSKIKKEFTGL